MKQLSGKHLCQLAEQEGWELKRINGSHYIYGKEGKVERLSIPVHGNTPLKIGLLKSLIKIMGIDESSL